MKNLQKDSPGSQWELQFSCQTLVASRCALIWRVSKALSRVCHANPLVQRSNDNFVAPNVSQSASLFYKICRGQGYYPKMFGLLRGSQVPGAGVLAGWPDQFVKTWCQKIRGQFLMLI